MVIFTTIMVPPHHHEHQGPFSGVVYVVTHNVLQNKPTWDTHSSLTGMEIPRVSFLFNSSMSFTSTNVWMIVIWSWGCFVVTVFVAKITSVPALVHVQIIPYVNYFSVAVLAESFLPLQLLSLAL